MCQNEAMRCLCTQAAFLIAALVIPSTTHAIDRDCPRGQVWNPNQGSCVKKKRKVTRLSPQQKYYEAVEHLEGTHRRPNAKRGVKLLSQACAKSHAESCNLLAFLHLNAREVSYDANKSLSLYRKSCGFKDPQGCLGAADIYSRGLLGRADHVSARRFLETSCRLSNATACYRLAEHYEKALGGKQNKARSTQLLTQAFRLARADCPKTGPSCHALGLMYKLGRGTKRNATNAFDAFKKGCDRGSGDACFELGIAYGIGSGTRKNRDRSIELYDRACKKYDRAIGCHDAGVILVQEKGGAPDKRLLMDYGHRACKLDKRQCDLLAYLYGTGKGGQQNHAKASKWYKLSCQHGNGVSCESAAFRAQRGLGMARNTKLALELHQRACDLKRASACYYLGKHYFDGKITSKDDRRAFRLFEIGCWRGEGRACQYAGFQLERGRDGTGHKRPRNAVIFYRESCLKGTPGGCRDLGRLYWKGTGVTKNLTEAQTLFSRACYRHGFDLACIDLGELYQEDNRPAKDRAKGGLAYAKACSLGNTRSCGWVNAAMANATEQQQSEARRYMLAGCNRKPANEHACYIYGELLAFGSHFTSKSNARAGVTMLRSSCDRKHADSCLALGRLYNFGVGVPRSLDKARDLYSAQCERSVHAGCRLLGHVLWSENKYEEALSLFRGACDGNDHAACNTIGFAYYTAKGVRWDVSQAVRHYKRACHKNFPLGCANLGEAYEYGIGVKRNLKQAFEFYRKSCTAVEMSGCSALARFHEKGLGGAKKDMTLAERNYRRSCGTDWEASAPACRALAEYYQRSGKGSASQIAQLFQKAFDMARDMAKTNPYGKYVLGKMHRDGVSVVKSGSKALEHFSAACDGYDPLGCIEAGKLLLGTADPDVKANYELATVRLNRACAAGIERACTLANEAKHRTKTGSDTTPSPKPKPGGPITAQPPKGCCETGRARPSSLILFVLVLAFATRARAS